MVAEPIALPEPCYHCGLDIPPGVEIFADVLGASRAMCCVGCCAVAEMLEAGGLARWYETRVDPTGVRPELVPDVLARSVFLENEDLTKQFLTKARGHLVEAMFLVEGVTCAACVWVIERHLEALDGVTSARMNGTSHRARVQWNPDRCALRDVIAHLAAIGFVARPDRPDLAVEMEREERRTALARLGVAGLGTMNVMTYAVALYVGAFDGMEPGVRAFLRWMCLLVTTPVVFIGARPFFEGAWRDLRFRRPGMDVPVALAIAGAYLVSGWAVVRGTGEVYFESACMFTFFLGLGRYLEMSVRHRSAALCRTLLEASPQVARRLEAGTERIVAAESLDVGDRFVVRAGEAMPADGTVVDGRSSVEETLLTGEPWPKAVGPGALVIAGSVNRESPLVIEATRVGRDTTLSLIVALVDQAQSEKPPVAVMADRVAGGFVMFVLFVATITAVGWAVTAPDRAIWVTLSVLVATCPCALGLATPAALAAATQGLAKAGLLITRGHVLEGLAKADHIVFDKTGTLTRGVPTLALVVPLRGDSKDRLVDLARALESRSEHPFARAFATAGAGARGRTGIDPVDLFAVPSAGVEGTIDSTRYRIGKPDWVSQIAKRTDVPELPSAEAHSWVYMADEVGPLAWFGIDDPVRSEAADSVRSLMDLDLSVELLSGDPGSAPSRIAGDLGIATATAAADPSAKVERMRRLHDEERVVVAVGDGVNDGPVMRAADVSIAMGGGCDLARISSDAVLINDDLSRLPLAISWARRTRRVVRQNFAWAIGYNLCALPLAVSGQLAPWLAAAGMSISSLIVVLNASRLGRAPVAR